MVADKRGNLWIIQEANNFPIGTTMTTQYPGAVLCYNTNGSYTGIEITGVANPAALAYDSVNDRLLIADNTNEDIAIYTNLTTTPTLQTTFGVQGGLYSGANPGLLDDPASGGLRAFLRHHRHRHRQLAATSTSPPACKAPICASSPPPGRWSGCSTGCPSVIAPPSTRPPTDRSLLPVLERDDELREHRAGQRMELHRL